MKPIILLMILLLVYVTGQAQTIDHSRLQLLVVPVIDSLSPQQDKSYYTATSAINTALIQSGYLNTQDANTMQETRDADIAFTTDKVKSSYMKDIIQHSPADIVIKTNMYWMDVPPGTTGQQLQITLKAVDKYTGNVYADALIQSQQRTFPSMEKAVSTTLSIDGKDAFTRFLTQLDQSYSNLLSYGRQAKLQFTVATEGKLKISDRINEVRLSESIENFVRKTAFKGRYRLLGESELYMEIYVQVPLVDEDGNSESPSHFIGRTIDNYFNTIGLDVGLNDRVQTLVYILNKKK